MSFPRNKGDDGRLKKGISGMVDARGDSQNASPSLFRKCSSMAEMISPPSVSGQNREPGTKRGQTHFVEVGHKCVCPLLVHIQDLNVRVRLPSLFPQNFQYPCNRLADVVFEFIHRFPLRIAAWEGWNLCPKSAFRVFVDDNSVVLHALIFSQWPTGVSIP
jgi:hypothetical protein